MLSIITPFYNKINSLIQLISSLEKQVCPNFEWIIVNDCSTVVTSSELQNIIKCSCLKRTTLIHNIENIGAGKSRNEGIKLAEGEYITFVDSDDYVSDSFVEEILNAVNNSEVDCLLFDYVRVTKNKNIKKSTLENIKSGRLKKETVLVHSNSNVCGKVYKREIISNYSILFPATKRFEDWAFDYQAYLCCNSFEYIKKNLYFYVDTSTSAVHTNKGLGYYYASESFKSFSKSLYEYNPEIYDYLIIKEILYMAIKENVHKLEEKQLIELEKTIYPGDYTKNAYYKYLDRTKKIILFLNKYRLFGIIERFV